MLDFRWPFFILIADEILLPLDIYKIYKRNQGLVCDSF